MAIYGLQMLKKAVDMIVYILEGSDLKFSFSNNSTQARW